MFYFFLPVKVKATIKLIDLTKEYLDKIIALENHFLELCMAKNKF